MTNLIELPPEILQYICATVVRDHGVQVAVQARGTCRVFNSEIVLAMWLTRAFEGPDRPSHRIRNSPILAEYLCLRTKSDLSRQYDLTAVIYDTIDSITNLARDALLPEIDLLREACLAIVRAHGGSWYPAHRTRFSPLDFSMFTPVGCTIAENTLAFAAHLGLMTVVQRLLKDGVSDFQTDFGYALHRVIEHETPLLTSIYLQTKLDISLDRAEKIPLYRTIINITKVKNCDIARSHRGISWYRYDRAIRHAASNGHVETAKLLVDALCYDDEQSEPLQRCCPATHFRTGGMATNSSHGLRIAAQNVVLVIAVIEKYCDMAEMALNNGADPNKKVYPLCWFETVLTAAALNGDLAMFKLLLCHGANLWKRTRRHLLSFVAEGGSLDIAKICLDSGMTNFSRSSCEEKISKEHPLLVAMRHRQRPKCHSMLQLMATHDISFEPGSELDQELCKIATSFGDAKSLDILDQIREEQQATTAIEGSNVSD